MKFTTKIFPVLCIVFSFSHLSAHPGAVVDDRSILLDSEMNTVSRNNNNNFNGNYQNLPQNKIAYNAPESELYPENPLNKYPENINHIDDNAAPVDLESVDKEYKPEVPVARQTGPNVNADVNPQDGYNQELVIPNATSHERTATTSPEYREQVVSDNPAAKLNTLRELESLPLKTRLNRIENILESQKNSSADSKFIALQEEVQRLRGVVEFQKHELEKALAQQKLVVDDLDRRVTQVPPSDKSNVSPVTSAAKTIYQDDKLTQQDLYTQAYSNIKTKNYAKAISLFNKYITDYPSGLFGANSNYWLGEIHMIQSDYPKALAAFDNVLNKYPKNSKSADALYKKGLIHIYMKDFTKAKTFLTAVKDQYKDTTAARLADKELQTLEKINGDA